MIDLTIRVIYSPAACFVIIYFFSSDVTQPLFVVDTTHNSINKKLT